MTRIKHTTVTRWRIAWRIQASGYTGNGEPVFASLDACADACKEADRSTKYDVLHWPEAVEVEAP